METKYYTPTIEEFHVGFEFERESLDSHRNHLGWEKEIFTSTTDLETIESFIGYHRVKHLDREDIESLGWQMAKSTWDRKDLTRTKFTFTSPPLIKDYLDFEFEINEHNIYMINIAPCFKVKISHAKKETKNFISKQGTSAIDTMIFTALFNGKIKNKSELKKVMQQLGIT